MTDLDQLKYPVGKAPRVAALDAAIRKTMIDTIADAPARYRSLTAGLSAAELDTPYRPGGWTIRQVVHHVPDSHMNAYIRMKLAITEETPAIRTYMEERWAELHPELEKRIGALWTLANIATLVGLLGTISGLIRAFGALGSAAPAQRAALLAAGISEAMWNTALGLGIAVICMTFHLFLHTQSKKIKHDMELATMKLENLLMQKGR